ncbi:MAG: hypothetical protein ACJAYU_004012 [Bradymonadia bacterium]|jgi:hypothetical protein
MNVDDPFGDDCSGELSSEQSERLNSAAAAVTWDSLESTYVPRDNPTCCCDQFFHTLTLTFNEPDETFSTAIDWCDESFEVLLPPSVVTFVGTLNAIADEVATSCASS